MKKINTRLTALAVLTTVVINTSQAATTTTEYSYTKEARDGSVTSKTMVVSERKTDKEILKLLDAKIDGYPALDDDVSFTVDDGIVALKGTVDNTSERDHAGLIAESIPGVMRVDNLINLE